MSNLPAKAGRIGEDIAALAALTEPGRPWTRRAFTPLHAEGRAWLAGRMRGAGLETRIDEAGNLIGRRMGCNPDAGVLMIGSHSDTVPEGGRFDGIAGVVAGLEVARILEERGIELAHDLEVVDFLSEEVSIFGVSCVGSRGMIGELPDDWLSREVGGRTLREAIREAGGTPGKAVARRDIRGFLELHIEQGPVLEARRQNVGVVSAVAGLTRFAVTMRGRPDHAGTAPMANRADALVEASRIVLAVREAATALSSKGGHFTATVGEMRVEPNAANVVPGQVTMLVDARASEREDMETFSGILAEAVETDGGEIRRLSDNPPALFDEALCGLLEMEALALGVAPPRMVSGAGHDAAWIRKIAPAAMLFVPCRDGRSHCQEEWAESGDIALGASVLFGSLLRLDRCLAEACEAR
ncbi:Zn-dependent hydrolase [Acidocella sp.]|uniref:Zn-dependent hydrolase n=1 Tax=Acidocella sp. TaxID=50710 RepID=UPI003D076F3A